MLSPQHSLEQCEKFMDTRMNKVYLYKIIGLYEIKNNEMKLNLS